MNNNSKTSEDEIERQKELIRQRLYDIESKEPEKINANKNLDEARDLLNQSRNLYAEENIKDARDSLNESRRLYAKENIIIFYHNLFEEFETDDENSTPEISDADD